MLQNKRGFEVNVRSRQAVRHGPEGAGEFTRCPDGATQPSSRADDRRLRPLKLRRKRDGFIATAGYGGASRAGAHVVHLSSAEMIFFWNLAWVPFPDSSSRDDELRSAGWRLGKEKENAQPRQRTSRSHGSRLTFCDSSNHDPARPGRPLRDTRRSRDRKRRRVATRVAAAGEALAP
jgi:hypothetical protein